MLVPCTPELVPEDAKGRPNAVEGARVLACVHGTSARPELLFFLFDHYRFEVFRFKNLSAIETFDVVHAIAAGNDLRPGVLTGELHKQRFIEIYSSHV